MGEVWRARDATLGREVAIKTLPAECAQDADRLARFEREARLLASLNHPNIASIHGLEDPGGTRFLVLELVDGDTMRSWLRAPEECFKPPIRHRSRPAQLNSTPSSRRLR